MRYEYVGPAAPANKIFRFTLNLYRDCSSGGAAFDNPAEIAIYRGNWTTSVLYGSFEVFNPATTLLTGFIDCPGILPPGLCLEKGTYTFERALPVVAGESYFIVYQRCCRAVTLMNIVTPDETGSTIMVEISPDVMALSDNSSPVLPLYPGAALCIHQPIHIIQAATDPDGDSLVYIFSAPFVGGGPDLNPPQVTSCSGAVPTPPCAPPYDSVTFVLPMYSPVTPMAGDPVIQIDPDSGILTGTPHQLGRFLAGITILEFRNGLLLSTTRREITFNVVDEVSGVDNYVQQKTSTFKIFPNPATGWAYWSENLKIEKISILDISGRFIELKMNSLAGFDAGVLNPGFYQIIGMTQEGKHIYSCLIVAR